MNTVQSILDKKEFNLSPPLPKFPTTRYQGSKRKILSELSNLLNTFEYNSILDLFSGSGIVSLLFRHLGKKVYANDFMAYSQNTAKVFLTTKLGSIDIQRARSELSYLLNDAPIKKPKLVTNNYSEIYFKDSENIEIDRFCQNISQIEPPYKNLYIYAVGQSLIKKRPYNLFHRANLNMRLKDVKRTFGNARTWETPIFDHAIKCITELHRFPIINNSLNHKTFGVNSAKLSLLPNNLDIIYLDPPYINGKGTSVDYSDFYHFLEGLIDYDLYESGDKNYPHKPINKRVSAWLDPNSAINELENICKYWKKSIIILSYRSDGLPTPQEIKKIMSINGRTVEVHSAGEYQYALSNNKNNEELFIISNPQV